MIVELISVGTELLLGNTINTNASYLARRCAKLGLSLYHQVTVGDNFDRLFDTIIVARERSDIIILTGGLGPTMDDITKEVVAKVVGKELIPDKHSEELLIKYFNLRHDKEITKNNYRQILKIEDSTVVDNNNGTAPGYIYEDDKGVIILLPGPPSEVIAMFEESIFPYLNEFQSQTIFSKMVKICGLGESKIETIIIDLINNQTNPTIAPYAKKGEVHLRITTLANTEEDADEIFAPTIKELQKRLGNLIFTLHEEELLETVVVNNLITNNLTISTGESCTGGLFSNRITNIPGASNVFKEGFITYSNEAKINNLGVKKSTIEQYGAISKEVAKEMALGLLYKTNSDFSIGITGNAGPESLEDKSNGLVYIACASKNNVIVEEFVIKGSRTKVKEYATTYALNLLRKELIKYDYL